jgi:F-type H+-transporting ATPase subunit b
MNLNYTLIGQTVVFFIFIWFCMKFVWPPIMSALHERRTKIADGLAAAEKGVHEEQLAKTRAAEILKEAKEQAGDIIRQAEKRAAEIVEEAKNDAKVEGDRLVKAAQAEIEQNITRAREELRGQVVSLAVAGASKVLKKEIDVKANEDLIKDLAAQL